MFGKINIKYSRMDDKELSFLYKIAKKLKCEGVIVEIGSWTGSSTIALAKGSKKGNKLKVYAVDHHKGSPEFSDYCKNALKEMGGSSLGNFMENIKREKVDDLIIPVISNSEECAPNFNLPISLLFIDGSHTYENVKRDFQLWYPKLIKKGIILFHDSGSKVTYRDGPKRVVEEFILKSDKFENVGEVCSITYATKK
jgi:predicted O-methyltransferase YrrM